MKVSNVLTLSLAAGGIIGLLIFLNRNNNTKKTKDSNNETADFSATAQQAALFYELFGVTRLGGTAFATPIISSNTVNRVMWLARNIENWSELQKKFTALCGGHYTILEAAGTALSSAKYKEFIDTVNQAQQHKKLYAVKKGTFGAKTFQPGDYMGRANKVGDPYVSFYIDDTLFMTVVQNVKII